MINYTNFPGGFIQAHASGKITLHLCDDHTSIAQRMTLSAAREMHAALAAEIANAEANVAKEAA